MLEYGGRQTICPTLLTTEDLGDIEPRVLLGEEFPCTNDTIGRIDQGAVHIEETGVNGILGESPITIYAITNGSLTLHQIQE